MLNFYDTTYIHDFINDKFLKKEDKNRILIIFIQSFFIQNVYNTF